MRDSFQLSDETAVIYPLLLFIVVLIPCLPKIRCINLDGPKFQFVRRRKQRIEEMGEEMRNSIASRTFVDCPLFPCIEFVSETTSYHSGSDWYIPSEDSMVDVVINETTYSVPLSLMMPNYTAWKWERERRKMIRVMGDHCKLKRSTSLPCISDLWSIANQQKLHTSRKCMQTTALAKSKLTKGDLREEVRVDVKEGDGIREDLKDFNHSHNMNPSKALISRNLSLKNTRDNLKLNMNEESQCWYISRSKSLDRDNYSMHKALKASKVENELPYRVYHSMDRPSFTYHQDIENSHNMRMNEDLVVLESPVYITDNREHMKSPEKESHVKIDMNVKTSYKSMSLTKMESYPKILGKCDSLALHSLSRKYMVSKPGASYYRSADSLSAKHASLKKGDRANSVSLKWDEQPFQKHPYSPFTCLKYQTEVCPTCDCGFPPKLCNCSSNSSRVGTVSENEHSLIVMEDEMEICPSLLQETSSGLYLNPSSTSRIVEEGREDDFTVMEIRPYSLCENRCCSTSDDKICTKIEID